MTANLIPLAVEATITVCDNSNRHERLEMSRPTYCVARNSEFVMETLNYVPDAHDSVFGYQSKHNSYKKKTLV